MFQLIGTLLLLIYTSIALPSSPSTIPLPLEPRQDTLDTRNDLLDGSPCKAVTVIFARGTVEPGNVGLLAGPPFFAALSPLVGGDSNLAVQGVDYPATIAGYLEGGDPGGAATLAQLTGQAASQCPDSKLVLSGYSQGAQLVHLGAAMLSQDVADRVAGVVMFGDPDDGQPFPDIPTAKIDTICIQGDLICDGLPIVDIDHLSYGFTAPQAAGFIASTLGY